MLVESWLARAARVAPERIAVETRSGSLTFGQLDREASAVASWLAGAGIGPGDHVGIELPAGLDFVRVLHGTMRAGAVAVPVDLRLGGRERDAVRASCLRVIDDLPAPMAALEGGRRLRVPAEPERLAHDLGTVAIVVHTSGTTATPRPIGLTYGNLLWSSLGSAVALGHDPDERWLCCLPLAHVGGLSILVRSAIHATTAVVHERFDVDAVHAALASGAATLVSLVATTLERLLEAGLRRPPHLRCALTGGGPVPPALVERAHACGVRVAATYGLTEACSQVATVPIEAVSRPPEGPPSGTAGPPLFCTQLALGDRGEILLRGPTVAPESIGADGWLHTGDLGSIDERGWLAVLGRRDDMIVTGGENVAPAEVEAVLAEHPAVAEAGVRGRADHHWGMAVHATVVLRAHTRASSDELRDHCASRLARYKVPKTIDFAESLPRTPSGKLVRRDL